MIKESLYFSYDGIKSYDLGIMNVSVASGMYSETFVAERNIIQNEIRGRSKPYFIDVEYGQIEIPITITLMDDIRFDESKTREIVRWLCQPYYKELYFSDNPSRIFYAMLKDSFEFIHNGAKQGYINLTFITNDHYSYSPIYTSQVYDLSSNPINGTIIEFVNNGDEICNPIIFIEKFGSGGFSIENLTHGNTMTFTGLLHDEILTIDCENSDIQTNISNIYRYDNHNDVFLELPRGVSRLKVTGNIKLRFKYQFKTLQG